MPELEDRSLMNQPLELLHLNFRNMRQDIEHEMVYLRQRIAQGLNIEDAIIRISKLTEHIRKTKERHRELTRVARARARFFFNHQVVPSCERTLTGSCHAVQYSLPLMVPIAQYLAERGVFDQALKRLLALRPDLVDLVDLNAIAEERQLIQHFKIQDYDFLLKWCKTHRSSLKKIGSKLELHVQLKQYKHLIQRDATLEALEFGRKAFSKPSPMDLFDIVQATSTLYAVNTSSVSKDFKRKPDKKKANGLDLHPTLRQPRTAGSTSSGSTSSASTMSPVPTSTSASTLDSSYISTTVLSSEAYEDQLDDASIDNVIAEIRQSVRQVYRRPKLNPLINEILIGSAALRCSWCEPGRHKEIALPSRIKPCPLCSLEKSGPLLEAVPLAQHTRSHLPSDLKMFPSGAIFGEKIIEVVTEKRSTIGQKGTFVRDPLSAEYVEVSALKSVFAV